MGKVHTVNITDFSGGMTSNLRTKDTRKCALMYGFEIDSIDGTLLPSRQSNSGDGNGANVKKQNFTLALNDNTTTPDKYAIYGLGIKSGDTVAEIEYKFLTVTGATSLANEDWANHTTANLYQGVGATDFELFTYYAKTGLIYGGVAGTAIWAFDPEVNSIATLDNDVIATDGGSAFTYTTLAEGLVHSQDDILYIPYDNKIAKNDNKTWVNAAITFPTHLQITSISEYGDFLAVACEPVGDAGNSVVYLWDRVSTTPTESIDWGTDNIKILEQLDGTLVGISTSRSVSFDGKLIFRAYDGTTAKIFDEFVMYDDDVATQGSLEIFKQKINQQLYFISSFIADGTTRRGIWKVSKNDRTGQFAITIAKAVNNDTRPTTMEGFFIYAQFFLSTYVLSGTFATSQTSETETDYAVNSVYESIKFGDPNKNFKLLSVGISTKELVLPAEVKLFFKANDNLINDASGDVTYTRLFKHGSRIVSISNASPAVVTLVEHGLAPNDQVTFYSIGRLPAGLTLNNTYHVIAAGITVDVFRVSLTRGGSAINTTDAGDGTFAILPLDQRRNHTAINLEGDHETVTITNASPAVLTQIRHNLVEDQIVRFTTNDTLPTGISTGTDYFVTASPTDDTFKISTTRGGSALNTSSAGSGIHSVHRDDSLPTFKEIQFRMESREQALITGLNITYEEIDDEIT